MPCKRGRRSPKLRAGVAGRWTWRSCSLTSSASRPGRSMPATRRHWNCAAGGRSGGRRQSPPTGAAGEAAGRRRNGRLSGRRRGGSGGRFGLTASWPDRGERAQPELRAGIHLGRPRKVGGDYLGVDVNIAARVGEAAKGDQVLVSEPARETLDPQAFELVRNRRLRAPEPPETSRSAGSAPLENEGFSSGAAVPSASRPAPSGCGSRTPHQPGHTARSRGYPQPGATGGSLPLSM